MTFTGKYSQFILLLGAGLLSASALVASSDDPKVGFVFSTVDPPGAVFSAPQGINDAGDISGVFDDARGRHGFIWSRGQWITIDYPGAAWTQALGINAQGEIVGVYALPGENSPFVYHGYFRSRKGAFTEVRYPGHLYEIPQRITSTGLILGCYHDLDFMSSMHGFTLSRGVFTGFAVPASMHNGATPDGTRITGLYTDMMTGQDHSYIVDRGAFTPFDVPGSTLTRAWDMNPQGDVVGNYLESSGAFHAFLRSEDGSFTTIDFPGSNNTQGRGVNARREIVGWYVDAAGIRHGFLATPK